MTNANWQQPQGMMTPPVDFEGVPDQPSKWPTVVGVIGIVLASIGLLCGCAGYFAVPLQRWGMSMQSQSGIANPVAEAQLKVAEQYQIVTYVLTTIGLALSAWLLFAAINLLRRRRSARGALMGWAIASIVALALNMTFQVLMMQAMVDELNAAGEGQRANEIWMGLAFGGCFGLIFGLTYQVFILIWFSRAKIKAEVSTWTSRGAI